MYITTNNSYLKKEKGKETLSECRFRGETFFHVPNLTEGLKS